MSESYKHTQIGWVTMVGMLFGGGIACVALYAGGLYTAFYAAGAVAALLFLLFATLTVSVDKDQLVASFGIGLIRKRVEWKDVRTFAAAKSPWYYGWGIRIYPGGVLYNVSGFDSVEFWLNNGKRCRIGTDEPDALCKAIEQHVGKPSPLSPSEVKEERQKARKWVWAILAFIVLIFAGVGVMMVVQSREPVVTVRSDAFLVESLFYGEEYPMADVESVSLEQSLPRIQARTNGFAMGSTLRGNFRLARLGEGKLFIDRSIPPFIVVRMKDTYVIVNSEDPAKTREVFTELKKYRP